MVRLIQASDAYYRLALYYMGFVQQHRTEFAVLDYEFLQIEQVLNWLAIRVNISVSQIFLELIEQINPYLQERSLHNIVVRHVNSCLDAAKRLGKNPGSLYMMAYRADWALGRWEEANEYITQATQVFQSDPSNYAASLRFLGSVQLNFAHYREALRTLEHARKIYHDLEDKKGEMSTQAEIAAYYLNKADYRTAYKLYSEVMDFQLYQDHKISDHILLMMGVTCRRLKKYSDAYSYLRQLLRRAQIARSRDSLAVAAHHIAWILIDEKKILFAKEYADFAKAAYEEIQDPRGVSDVDEQLGLIAVAMGEYAKSRLFLERSSAIRKQLGNQQGYASTLRRLAKLSFVQAQFVRGIYYFIQSLFRYNKIGMLPVSRVYKFIRDILSHKIDI